MTEETIDYINIPKERIAVLLGKKGEVKRKIEKETGVKVDVDSKSGEVTVTRFSEKDPILGIRALDIIKAIARGFSPQKAFKLLLPNIYIQIISLPDYVSGKKLETVRGRIIGREGKSRENISRLTSTDMVIYGKTVSIIGEEESVGLATKAVEKLIQGAPHNTVFRFLERQRSE